MEVETSRGAGEPSTPSPNPAPIPAPRPCGWRPCSPGGSAAVPVQPPDPDHAVRTHGDPGAADGQAHRHRRSSTSWPASAGGPVHWRWRSSRPCTRGRRRRGAHPGRRRLPRPAPPTTAPYVLVGHSTLDIPCGPTTYSARVDWYFPARDAAGTVDPQGMIWVQNGFLANSGFYTALATNLSASTNSIVVVPTITSNPFSCFGCWLNGPSMQAGAASLFTGNRQALLDSAVAARLRRRGPAGPLHPERAFGGRRLRGGHGRLLHQQSAGEHPRSEGRRDVRRRPGDRCAVQRGAPAARATTSRSTRSRPRTRSGTSGAAAPTSWSPPARRVQRCGDLPRLARRLDAGRQPDRRLLRAAGHQFSPPGATQAVYTYADGWINDMYTPAQPPSVGPLYPGAQPAGPVPAKATTVCPRRPASSTRSAGHLRHHRSSVPCSGLTAHRRPASDC